MKPLCPQVRNCSCRISPTAEGTACNSLCSAAAVQERCISSINQVIRSLSCFGRTVIIRRFGVRMEDDKLQDLFEANAQADQDFEKLRTPMTILFSDIKDSTGFAE